MIDKIIINGRLVQKDQPLFFAHNRSFRYGDGLFESMKSLQGEIPWLEAHLERLYKGMQVLQLQPHPDLTAEKITELAFQLTGPKPAKLRLGLYRMGRGTYLPESNLTGYLLEAQKLEDPLFNFPENGLHCDCFADHVLQGNSIENLKTANRLSNVLAALWAKQNGLDDALTLHQDGSIAEASSSNLFFIKDQRWYTPPLSTGCLEGVTRSKMMDIAAELGINLTEHEVFPDQLAYFDSIWMCNSIRGVQWIKQIGSLQFQPGSINAVIQKLNEKLNIHE